MMWFQRAVTVFNVILAFRALEVGRTCVHDLLYTVRYTSASASVAVKDMNQSLQFGTGAAVVYGSMRLTDRVWSTVKEALQLCGK